MKKQGKIKKIAKFFLAFYGMLAIFYTIFKAGIWLLNHVEVIVK